MGQEVSHMELEEGLQLGTYRVVSALTDTAIQVSDHDHTKIVAWERHEGENQKWFLQQSGSGYIFKNCRHGSYLAVCSTDVHSLVYAARFPTTWALLKAGDYYIIQFANNNRMIDLHFGWGTNGNEMHIWPPDGRPKQTWKFELLSTETGETHSLASQEESARLRRELHEKYDILLHKEQELTAKEAELDKQQQEMVEKEEKFMRMKGELASKEAIISKQENSIHQLQKDLEAIKEELAQARKANEGASRHADFKDELSQQQTETATLQARMDRFEYLMFKVMNKDQGSLHEMT